MSFDNPPRVTFDRLRCALYSHAALDLQRHGPRSNRCATRRNRPPAPCAAIHWQRYAGQSQ